MGFRRFAANAALLVIVALAIVGPALSALADEGGAFGKVHWGRKRTPFTLQVGSNVSSDWERYLNRYAKKWSKSRVVNYRVVDGNTKPKKCRPSNGMVEVCSAKYGTTGWIGITQLRFISGEHIVWATVKMNETYFRQKNGLYNTRNARLHTMCHELGHALGLAHPADESRSCVNDSLELLESTLAPSTQDFNNLDKMYDHRDSEVTVGRDKSRDRSATAFFDPAMISGLDVSEDGTHTVTETRLPDGSTVVTFITWAAEGE